MQDALQSQKRPRRGELPSREEAQRAVRGSSSCQTAERSESDVASVLHWKDAVAAARHASQDSPLLGSALTDTFGYRLAS